MQFPLTSSESIFFLNFDSFDDSVDIKKHIRARSEQSGTHFARKFVFHFFLSFPSPTIFSSRTFTFTNRSKRKLNIKCSHMPLRSSVPGSYFVNFYVKFKFRMGIGEAATLFINSEKNGDNSKLIRVFLSNLPL